MDGEISSQTISPEAPSNDDLTVAACVLLIAIARADEHVSDTEQKQIFEILHQQYDLLDEEIQILWDRADKERTQSTDLWRFTNQLNEAFSKDQKMGVMENIWDVIYADGRLDQYEDYLVHKLANLLRLQHKDLIAAKLRAKDKLGNRESS
jgi:uncharacterized tellurite resistance protein B-like protein